MVGMLNSRLLRRTRRLGLLVVAMLIAWLVAPSAAYAAAGPAEPATRPLAAPNPDPFNGRVPGDVSDGNGLLPPANNPSNAGPIVEKAMPGVNKTQTRFGEIDDTDRVFLVKVRQAGLWERPAGFMAQQQASSERVKEIGRILAEDHKQLDEECRFIAQQLNVALPDQPSAEQQAWMREFGPMKGHDFDVTAVKWLRFAHGGVFSAIASVRANTRNDMMRLYAERANGMVNKHMSLLESTGLVQYDNLPHAAIGVPAIVQASTATPENKDSNFFRLPIVALVVVTGLLAIVSIRRVVGGS
jgi:predicted outer membrane protein